MMPLLALGIRWMVGRVVYCTGLILRRTCLPRCHPFKSDTILT